MTDNKKIIVKKLTTIGLPVINELFFTTDNELPCITYTQQNDIQTARGNTLGYSRQYFVVSIWAKTEEELMNYIQKIDDVMRELNCDRTNSSDSWADNVGRIANTYEVLIKETYK